MLEFEQRSYNKHKTPTISVFKDGEVKLMKTKVNASVRVSSVLDVNPDDATFTILFNLNLKWNDPHLKFFYLKEKNEQNYITDNLSKTIWIPSMKFMLGISICNELYEHIFGSFLISMPIKGFWVLVFKWAQDHLLLENYSILTTSCSFVF